MNKNPKCPECGRKGRLQGFTLNGNLERRPQEYKCKAGHYWPVEWICECLNTTYTDYQCDICKKDVYDEIVGDGKAGEPVCTCSLSRSQAHNAIFLHEKQVFRCPVHGKAEGPDDFDCELPFSFEDCEGMDCYKSCPRRPKEDDD